MTIGLGEMLPGFLLDTLSFGGQDVSPTGDITVNGTGIVYGKSFPLRRGITYGWELQFTSVGAVNVMVELEQGNQRPATEGSSDSAWAIPDNKTASPMFAAITDTNAHFVAYSPDATAFGRLKFTGISGNNAATKVHVARAYCIKTV